MAREITWAITALSDKNARLKTCSKRRIYNTLSRKDVLSSAGEGHHVHRCGRMMPLISHGTHFEGIPFLASVTHKSSLGSLSLSGANLISYSAQKCRLQKAVITLLYRIQPKAVLPL